MLSNDYVAYPNESYYNIGQVVDHVSSNEMLSCAERNKWLVASENEL